MWLRQMLEICRSLVFYLNCDVVGEFFDKTFLRLCGNNICNEKYGYYDDMENIHDDDLSIIVNILPDKI